MTAPATLGFVLRLAGPFQAYGGPSAFNDRDTRAHPSRSALIGLFAAAEGRPRETALHPFTTGPLNGLSYHQLSFAIRVDAPGHRYTDFHTTGASRPRHQQLHTAGGGRRTEGKEAHISRRTYLTDAAFTVAVTGPAALIGHITHTLEHPHWAPYLGRRNCIPDEPLLLTGPSTNPVHHLLHHTPLTPPHPPPPDTTTLPVTFWWDTPPTTRPAETQQEAIDDPTDFTPHHRTWNLRPQWRTTEPLPTTLYAGPHPLTALIAYTQQETPCTT
ncbi:type I-E CRISPR-associated protein Cas5/CasD [Streptomyces cyaneofuscatus]|uniref:type I-E CRISPR-associated protein Cas5/CasD n=1 Tax=Streptomyces cyaneofuscatus TaxID=66883 RepID=UPI00345C902F